MDFQDVSERRIASAAYFGVLLPSRSVALVRSSSNKSARLPTKCDVCQELIKDYPYVAKHSTSGHRRYHVECALRIELVSLVHMPSTESAVNPVPQVLLVQEK